MKIKKPVGRPRKPVRQINESERLEALRAYQILDTDPEKVFDELAQLAAFICGTPIALVSLIDSHRQWWKARVGLEGTETPRELAFCEHAMQGSTVYEVADATQDPLFEENPLVTGDPHIRFYAGAPLHTPEGHPLGTLCAIDTVPRELSEEQREALRILARQVMTQLELRRVRLQLEEERQKLEGVLRMANSTGEALYTGGRNEIFVKQDQRLVRVLTAEIQYVEALGDYVNIHTTRERLTVYSTMKDMEAKLPGRDFARVHRKYIVRLDRIVTIEADTALLDAVRDSGTSRPPVQVPIGSSYKALLLGRLNLV
ncbi:hypothetical protein GCM10023185_08570 [Hymenobacter saemangeumensis]|uniref:HTH LytTR-type domain-containing protein n=1 Tax=Hymenobacter saemangeumensis TaxID=1084522 RepID=A0ABP8I3J9_9BACT